MAKKPKPSAAPNSPHFIVSEPISVLERDLKADGKGLFKALGKSVLHIGTGKFWELAGDASEAAAALGLKTDAGGLTWYLIRRSLQKAMLALVDEGWIHRPDNAPNPSDDLGNKLDAEVTSTRLEVNVRCLNFLDQGQSETQDTRNHEQESLSTLQPGVQRQGRRPAQPW